MEGMWLTKYYMKLKWKFWKILVIAVADLVKFSIPLVGWVGQVPVITKSKKSGNSDFSNVKWWRRKFFNETLLMIRQYWFRSIRKPIMRIKKKYKKSKYFTFYPKLLYPRSNLTLIGKSYLVFRLGFHNTLLKHTFFQ